MKSDSLRQFYIEQLRDLYNAESQIVKALPKMVEKATHPALKDAFQLHVEQTQQHIDRLQRIFTMLGERPSGEKCKGMEGLLDEAQDTMKKHDNSDVLDAAMIAMAQRVEHYEMAGYGCVRTYANTLGLSDQAQILQETLTEEGETDHKLTAIAEDVVNADALRAG
ncbi:MAG TPA: ferritin-like domain-containing protein [Gemmatimonadaceae bacterium]|nr:ferritin-like domain-containing protein [Gemmatimonadaceae bacterium]